MATATASAPVKGKKSAAAPASAKARAAATAPAATAAAPAAKAPKEAKPAKPRVAMSEEELNALIAGTLKPRPTKGSTEQESLNMRGESGRATGRPVGVTTGLPIFPAWGYMFQENEKRGARSKWTDQQILDWMIAEFPGRETASFVLGAVNVLRKMYNQGKLTKLHVPKLISKRYDEKGNVLEGRQPRQKSAAPAAVPAAQPVGETVEA